MRGLTIALTAVLALGLAACDDHQSADRDHQDALMNRAQEMYPVPEIRDFPARAAIQAHVNRWQDPNVVSFVTLFAETGQPIGYYEAQGKVVSTCQALTAVDRVSNGTRRTAPSVDGTYYANSECGIYFFTADSDTYVEWSGAYLVTDHPLPLDVQPLEISDAEDG